MNEKQSPNKQPERQESTAGQQFQQPPQQAVRPPAEEQYQEEASMNPFEEPKEGASEGENAALTEAPTGYGVDPALLEIKRQIEQQLMAAPSGGAVEAETALSGSGNIVGVGIGSGVPEGSGLDSLSAAFEPGNAVLNVYVAEPASAEEVKAAIVDSMGVSAASSDDVPVNVIVTGIVDAQPHRWRLRPAPGGVSVAHFRVTAGTIACLALGNSAPWNNRVLVLSNNHVLANSNNAVYGDCIAQPGPADGGSCPRDQIAILARFIPINFAGACNYVDAAYGWCWSDRVRRELVYVSGGSLQYFRIGSTPINPAVNMIVGKSGRTTQLTTGRVIGISETIRVNYGSGRVALFCDQISIRSLNANPFSAGGDSGSSIWTWDAARRPVGLLFAGGGGITFANKMTRVVAALNIRLYT